MTNYFSKEYLNYWDNAVKKSVDGLPIAGEDIQRLYLKKMKLKMTDKILDVGCGSGRNHSVLANFTKQIFGIDISYDYLDKASDYPYIALVKAGLEDTKFPASYFDLLFVWAVFDLVEQTTALYEANRVLAVGGKILLTAKNVNYSLDDQPALVAERNAKLKNFPHRYTNADKLCGILGRLGFKLVELITFPKRGDLAINHQEVDAKTFYEFILIAEKITMPIDLTTEDISQEFSSAALQHSKGNNNADIMSFFKSNYFQDL